MNTSTWVILGALVLVFLIRRRSMEDSAGVRIMTAGEIKYGITPLDEWVTPVGI